MRKNANGTQLSDTGLQGAGNISNVPDISPGPPSEEPAAGSGRRRRRAAIGQKACSISCAAGGIAGAIAIAACTAVTCVLYGTGAMPIYAVGFPHGASIASVSAGTDDAGRPVIDATLSMPDTSDIPDTPDQGIANSGPDTSGSGVSEPDTSDNGAGVPGTSDPGVSEPDASGSGAGVPGTPDPGVPGPAESLPMPDTGEDPPGRVSALMEAELLRARERRLGEGLAPYPDTDSAIPADRGIAAIAAEYGFTEEFVRAYNSGAGAVPGIIMIPAA